MNRKTLLFLLGCFLTFETRSQAYGNEWIDFTKAYYAFPLALDGVYRISHAQLAASGFPIASVDPRNIRIMARGGEIPIYIEGEGDAVFDSTDFIEFFGRKNDGYFDSAFYTSPSQQAHSHYSFFTDTIYYFISWDNTTPGKRFSAENDVAYPSYTASQYVLRKSFASYNTVYSDGKTETGGGTDPAYLTTEGWFDNPFGLGSSRVKNVPTTRVFTTGPAAQIEWKILGESDFENLSPDHHLNVQFASLVFDTLYEGYEAITKKFSVAASALGGTNTTFTFRSINDLGSGADRTAISYISVKYPHQLNFNNVNAFTFFLPDHGSQVKSYLPFSNFSFIGRLWVYDLTNEKRITVTTTASNHEVLIPNSGNEKECHVFSEGNVLSVSSIKAINGTSFFTDYTQLQRPDGYIIISHPSLSTSSSQYATYRNSGGHGALVVNVEELYLQFSQGIRKHPLSIRNFIAYIFANWPESPKNLLLLGKSVNAKLFRNTPANFASDLVPSFGNPASDILLTAGLGSTVLEPMLPTGRLSAKNNTGVTDYLQKVMEYEGNSPQKWMKNILHFAGGSSGTETNRFLQYLNSYADILEAEYFGGKILTFKKNSTAPIQISLSDSIRNLINNGASILTFFGHASTTGGFDQNIDDPQFYSNKGKYPLLVGNSCFTGDIHEAGGESVSEKFVLIKDKGMIAFLASVDLGLESELRDYTQAYFNSVSKINYGGSLGEHAIFAIKHIQDINPTYPVRSVALLMTLHGDPALSVNSAALADYEITAAQVQTIPDPVTTGIDTFSLDIKIYNYGKALTDSVYVAIDRFYPDMAVDNLQLLLPPLMFESNLTVKLPVDVIKSPGFNRIDISVDPSNLVTESSEVNNFVSIPVFIKSGDIIPAIPFEFAIVPDQGPELKASTGYPFEGSNQYEFQIDTNASFAFPIENTLLTSAGGVVSWKPTSLSSMTDSAVYFWRTRNASGEINSVWRTSSFQYIKDKTGWSQDHFDQFKKDDLLFIEMIDSSRQFQFLPTVKKLTCQTTSTLDVSNLGDVLYKIDANLMEYGGCGLGPAIHIAVLDSLTFTPWGTPFQGQNPSHYFGQINFDGNCGKPRVQNFFIFQAANATQLAGMKNMLTNAVPDGNFILAWTWVRNDFSKWDLADPTLRGVFTALGSDSITLIQNDSLPYIFFAQKGKPSTAVEVIGANYDEFIYLFSDLKNSTTYGNIAAPRIGPSSGWDSIHWNHYSITDPLTDSLTLYMRGYAKDGKTLMSDAQFKKDQKLNDISNRINHLTAPYMELDLLVTDNIMQTAPQVERLTVLYDGVPEFALNAAEHFEFHADSVQEGEMVKFSIAVKNISLYDSDSLLISYSIIDKDRLVHEITYQKQAPLMASSSMISSVEYSSVGLRGNNTLVIEVNPGMAQLEQHQFNNIGHMPFYVQSDQTNPILDVTFDGSHILDGDIVSARPSILVQLTDENPFMILDDTSDFSVFLTQPGGSEKQYFFSSTENSYSMQFIPATSGKNKARVEFRPVLDLDGNYQLRVRASDRSANESGSNDYAIGFEVINRSTITHLMNYPNPFSTSTRFVFILTGWRIPDNIQVQIMTVSGKLVKTIEMPEMGPIRIGRNVTTYAWDGRDEYGDKLANGVYLYRVNTRMDGQEIEHRSNSADSFFRQGFGKMVILR